MRRARMIIVSLVLVVLAGLALYWGIGRTRARPKPPKKLLGLMVPKIDTETLEVIVLPYGEWLKLGSDEEGNFVNPKTGKHTMREIMFCSECGGMIPKPRLSMDEWGDDAAMWRTCPRCGRRHYLGYHATPEQRASLKKLVSEAGKK